MMPSRRDSGLSQGPVARSVVGTAFTIIELLVTMAVLSIFVVLLFSVTDNSFKLWRQTASDIAMFDSARAAFDTLSRRLSQATLNTYLDYYKVAGGSWIRRTPGDTAFVPNKYGRASDLAIFSGEAKGILGGDQQGHGIFFFAPLGYTGGNASLTDLPNLLNPLGYYVEWGDDSTLRPAFLDPLPKRSRFRLIEHIQPSQNFTYFEKFTDGNPNNDLPEDWIPATVASTGSQKNVLADNILALIIRPEVTSKEADLLGLADPWDLTEDYTYDSRADESRSHPPEDIQFAQLPPMLRVVLVAVSEKDAARLVGTGTAIPDAFKFQAGWFTDPAKLDTDLDALSKQLSDQNVQFRVFNQVIPLRGAKFSARKEK